MKTLFRFTAGTRVAARSCKGLGIGSGLLLALLLGFGTASSVSASDPIGVYVIVDRVVLEPKEGEPERAQIWGAIAVAEGHGHTYGPATNGYLYFKLKPGKEETCRKEWKDLQSVAGSGQIVGFGSRYQEKGVVRKADAPVQNPDIYPIGFGLVKVGDGRRAEFKTFQELRQLRPAKGAKVPASDAGKEKEKKP